MPARKASFSSRGVEEQVKSALSVVEDALQLWSHPQPVSEITDRTKRQRIEHFVRDQRSSLPGFESVRVMPEAIWPTQLDVNEAPRGIIEGNICRPSDGDAKQSNPVVNQRPHPHRDGRWREQFKSQVWGSDLGEVLGALKEGEHYVHRLLHPLLAEELMHLHNMFARLV